MTTDEKYGELKASFTGKYNLVLVDKDDISLFHNRIIARACGLFSSIRSTTNGVAARNLLDRASDGTVPFPDIILYDLDTPLTDNLQTLTELQQWNSNNGQRVACMILSARVMTDPEKETACSLGIKHVLPKPLTEESLTLAIRSVTRKRYELEKTEPQLFTQPTRHAQI